MKYFLRFTRTPEADMKRGFSVHFTGTDRNEFATISEAREAFADNCENGEKVVWSKKENQWAIRMDGLCGFEVESLEDGIERGRDKEDFYNQAYEGHFAIFDGEYAESDCPEGDCFKPKNILHKE